MNDEDRALIDISDALASGPALNLGIEGGWYRDPKAVQRRAAEVIAEIPHPPGPKSAASLRWGDGEQMSSLTEGDIQLMVQANAMCDWLIYALKGADADEVPPVARIVLSHLPSWPALRGGHREHELEAAAKAVESADLTRLRTLAERCQRRYAGGR